MIRDIDALTASVYENKLEQERARSRQREAEFKMLASQINPHFLFNTLESIRMKARACGDTEVADMVKMLAKLMRHSIEVRDSLVPVKDELSLTEYYLKLQHYRFGDAVQFTVTAESGCEQLFILPLLVQPLKLGADVVVHSATKYLNGHGDVVAGFSVARKEIMDKIRMIGLKDITGTVLGPQEAFLILCGLKTLKARMDAVCANTQKVVDFLAGSKYVQKVFYPGLENHPDHTVATREMTRFGGVVSFEMGSFEEAKKVLNHVHLCALAVSLGDCETLIQHPASMTHSMCTKEEIEAAGFSDRLFRLAVGLEDPDDIIADLQQAFEAAQN